METLAQEFAEPGGFLPLEPEDRALREPTGEDLHEAGMRVPCDEGPERHRKVRVLVPVHVPEARLGRAAHVQRVRVDVAVIAVHPVRNATLRLLIMAGGSRRSFFEACEFL
jgi:hypothetical protein